MFLGFVNAILLGVIGFNLAQATITVTPVYPNTAPTNATTFYYAAANYPASLYTAAGGTAPTQNGFIAPGFTAFDLTTGIYAKNQATNNMVLLDITSTTKFTPTTGQGVYLYLSITPNAQSTPVPIPIAAAGLSGGVPPNCAGGGNSLCANPAGFFDGTPGNGSQPLYMMVNYTSGQTIRVGVYPLDICYYPDLIYANNVSPSGTAFGQGCAYNAPNYSVINPGAGGDVTSALNLTANIYLANTTATLSQSAPSTWVYPLASGGTNDTGNFTLSFSQQAPTLSCNSLQNAYFPSDGGIIVSPGAVQGVPVGGGGPVVSTVVTAKRGGTADSTSAAYKNNDVYATIPYNSNGVALGFNNLTSATDISNNYDVLFSVQDQAGWVANFQPSATPGLSGTAGNCEIPNVQTSKILTFLSTSKCFIATGAFRSDSAVPVLLLRDFRDRVLLHTSLGKAFVNLYYQNSPKYGEWLWYHPEYRYPVIALLSPLILLAWLILNPLALLTVVSGVIALISIRKYRMRSA